MFVVFKPLLALWKFLFKNLSEAKANMLLLWTALLSVWALAKAFSFLIFQTVPSDTRTTGFASKVTSRTEQRIPKQAAWICLYSFVLCPIKNQTNQIGGFCFPAVDAFGILTAEDSSAATSSDPATGSSAKVPNEAALLALMDRTGYSMVQENQQLKYRGPLPAWEGAHPQRGCEVFVGKIPRHVCEDELVPVL